VTVKIRDGDDAAAYDCGARESLRRVFAAHARSRGLRPEDLAYFVPPLRTALPHQCPADLGLDGDGAPPLVCVGLKAPPAARGAA
jgi:hypothetical protein